jgi:hypothetical protein
MYCAKLQVASWVAIAAFSTSAWAADETAPAVAPSGAPSGGQGDNASAQTQTEAESAYGGDVRAMVPQVSYTYSAHGAPEKTLGAAFTGFGLADTTTTNGARSGGSVIGGGISVWGSPLSRLTIIGDATRNVYREFSPALGATFRLMGKPGEGLNLGALVRYKVDGFGRGPTKDEVEGELEGGMLVGYHQKRLHLELNTILGVGTTEEGEVDVEARGRVGYDLSEHLRVGVDGQSRFRVAGPGILSNGQSYDWVLGPQAMVSSGHFFGSFLAGPTTTGTISPKVGAIVAISVGGTTF